MVFTTLDLRQGFNQIQIREEDRAKTAFHGVDGLWEWNGMPFGMCNSSAFFQQVMDIVLGDIDCAAYYIDDVVIFSRDSTSHVADVERVLGTIINAGLTCHPGKCKFGECTVKYLGFEVSDETLSVQEAKVAVLDKVAVPTDATRDPGIPELLHKIRAQLQQASKRAEPAPEGDHNVEMGRARRRCAERPAGGSEDGAGAHLARERQAIRTILGLEQLRHGSSAVPRDGAGREGRGIRQQELQPNRSQLQLIRRRRNGGGMGNRTLSYEYEFKIRHRPGKTLQHVDGLSRNPPPLERGSQAACLVALASGIQTTEEAEGRGKGPEDVWEDAAVLRWVKGETEAEEDVGEGVRARGRHYRCATADHRMVVGGVTEGCEGGRGRLRTVQRKQGNSGKGAAGLQSLPIRGLGYRWSLNLAEELPLSRKNKRYVLVMIEHVSKWVELRTLSSMSAELIAEAFTDQVLTRFGACGEVLTDQGTEFRGAFDQLLKKVGITHRRTSRYHPQANGLTERMVQTIKKGLRAYGEEHKRDWDQELNWVAAGYRFCKQAALRDSSPYYLLYGKEPMLPVNAPKVLSGIVRAGTHEKWAALADCRARYLKKIMLAALENLHTAQLRDGKRYQQRLLQNGKGTGKPVENGTEVYIRKAKKDTLDMGVLVLESEEGKQCEDHVTNVARVTGSKMKGIPKDQQQEQSRSRKGASG
ncbi:unnamed protein product [Closterium sp. Yama58-4]|nr:unnamed protein product [Closterium sp. Yama58-4]